VASANPLLKPPTRPLTERGFDVLVWGGLLVLLIVSFGPVELQKLPLVFTNSGNMREFGAGFMRPDFSHFGDIVGKMWLTIQIALWGTVLSLFVAIPLGLLGARNLTPWWVQFPVRRLLDILRSVPDLVVAYVFIVAVGLGPFAGVMAFALNTGGVLGKLFAEAVESIEPGPIEGIRATGASRLQEIAWGVIPQVAPLWTSYGLYRFESNARSATVLGLIGGGGIGYSLFNALQSFDYAGTAAIVIVIAVAVAGIDLLSQTIRSRLI
jgi:phosphonate transport system permease protein